MHMSITLVRFLFVVTAAVSTEGFTAAEKQDIVDHHNDVRSNVQPTASNMLKLKWNDELAATAQSHADKCIFRHNRERSSSTSFSYVGENLALYNTYNAQAVVE
ncbi:peptidase inhibitor 16-like [Mizuhopecten yessoensis]|uniref:peptidase inhibitor 16-like n=1 Tax=Mizuhopecten yessoensis TaxID=6573 RepID=UPI000B45D125|nr:peptidase inhibitor 16-like [Mizuhopecten yessoensis]